MGCLPTCRWMSGWTWHVEEHGRNVSRRSGPQGAPGRPPKTRCASPPSVHATAVPPPVLDPRPATRGTHPEGDRPGPAVRGGRSHCVPRPRLPPRPDERAHRVRPRARLVPAHRRHRAVAAPRADSSCADVLRPLVAETLGLVIEEKDWRSGRSGVADDRGVAPRGLPPVGFSVREGAPYMRSEAVCWLRLYNLEHVVGRRCCTRSRWRGALDKPAPRWAATSVRDRSGAFRRARP